MRTTSIITNGCAITLVLGLIGTIFAPNDSETGVLAKQCCSVVFLISAIGFGTAQMMQQDLSDKMSIKRLRRTMNAGYTFLMLAGLLLVETNLHLLRPLFTGSVDSMSFYYHYIYNNWAVLLLAAGIIIAYSTIRMSQILHKS